MKKKKNNSIDFSYYQLNLLSYLKESHPNLANDIEFIKLRAEQAADIYSQAIVHGLSHTVAAELSNRVLFKGLLFSRFDTIMEVLSIEFEKEIPENSLYKTALDLMPVCEEVFSKYKINDDFDYSPEYERLYTELTGCIMIWLDDYGL